MAKLVGLKTFTSISQPPKVGSRINAATLFTVYEDFNDGSQRPVANDLTKAQAEKYMLDNAPAEVSETGVTSGA